MRKLIARFRRWKNWKQYNNMSGYYKFLVLLGIYHSPTFEVWVYQERK